MPLTACFNGANSDLSLLEHELPAAARGQLQLDLLRSGICGTDVHIHAGKLPMPVPLPMPG